MSFHPWRADAAGKALFSIYYVFEKVGELIMGVVKTIGDGVGRQFGSIANIFNIRAVLLGLAARYLVQRQNVENASEAFVVRAG